MKVAIVAAVLCAFAACAPVQEREFSFTHAPNGSVIAVGDGATFDIKTGKNWWQRLGDTPHRMIVLHVTPADWEFHSERSDPDVWTRLTTAGSFLPPVMPSIPVTPSP